MIFLNTDLWIAPAHIWPVCASLSRCKILVGMKHFESFRHVMKIVPCLFHGALDPDHFQLDSRVSYGPEYFIYTALNCSGGGEGLCSLMTQKCTESQRYGHSGRGLTPDSFIGQFRLAEVFRAALWPRGRRYIKWVLEATKTCLSHKNVFFKNIPLCWSLTVTFLA